MIFDIFTHIIPAKYVMVLEKAAASGKIPAISTLAKREWSVPGMANVTDRFKIKTDFLEIREVLSLSGPFLETFAGEDYAPELAKVANNEVAETVTKYPELFTAGTGILPLNNLEASLREIDRCIKELKLRGIQIGTDVNGKPLDSPELMPIYQKMEQYDLPIFIHPSKNYLVPEYPGDTESKYETFSMVGWPHSTTLAMLRLSFSGVLEKYPKLKFIAHHAGGTVPYLAKRIEGSDRSILPMPVGEYLRRFYGDTAVQGNTANLMCAHAFFGARHLCFGTDFPFGANRLGVALHSVEEMAIPSSEKKMILEGNARELLRLS